MSTPPPGKRRRDFEEDGVERDGRPIRPRMATNGSDETEGEFPGLRPAMDIAIESNFDDASARELPADRNESESEHGSTLVDADADADARTTPALRHTSLNLIPTITSADNLDLPSLRARLADLEAAVSRRADRLELAKFDREALRVELEAAEAAIEDEEKELWEARGELAGLGMRVAKAQIAEREMRARSLGLEG